MGTRSLTSTKGMKKGHQYVGTVVKSALRGVIRELALMEGVKD